MRWAWLAPAAALFLLLSSMKTNLMSVESHRHGTARGPSSMPAVMASLYAGRAEGWNVVSKPIDWTNAGNIKTSNGYFFLYSTNATQD
jgi:hypothetical protein